MTEHDPRECAVCASLLNAYDEAQVVIVAEPTQDEIRDFERHGWDVTVVKGMDDD